MPRKYTRKSNKHCSAKEVRQIALPMGYEKYFNRRQQLLLKYYLANSSMNEIAKILEIPRECLLSEFILLGKSLAYMHLCEGKIPLIKQRTSQANTFDSGWLACLKTVKGVMENGR